jgi:hypothetical protein
MAMKRSLWPLALLPLLVVGFLASLGSSAARDDAYVVVRRAAARADGEPTKLEYPDAHDPGLAGVRFLMARGFPAELLRTFAMTRRFVERTAPDGSVVHARATAPLYLALGVDDTFRDTPYRDRILGHGPFATRIPADVPLVWVDEELATAPPGAADGAALNEIVIGLGKAIVSLVAPLPANQQAELAVRPYPLRDGYVAFLLVVAAEWGSRPDVAGAQDSMYDEEARDYMRSFPLFARVRANEAARHEAQLGDFEYMDRDPEVIATVLYRMAASDLGRTMERDDAYLPFLAEPPPHGIPAALLLGAFRNFQAKLLSAWSAAVRAGHRPATLTDLVEAYADAHPLERAEARRILAVTTGRGPAWQ